jgi:phosphoglucosamine mutase
MYPQVLLNVRVEDKARVMEDPRLKAAIEEATRRLAGRGRVSVRPSGTEPLIRVMVEAEEGAEAVAQELARVVEAPGVS